MLDTFIKSKGVTKTIIHNNNKNYSNEMNWDADYDGEKANISLNIDANGKKEHMEIKMNSDELAEILNIPSDNTLLDKRLYNDFLSKRPKKEYKIIELPKDSYEKYKKMVHFADDNVINDMNDINDINDNDIYTHISSPEPQQEIILPLVIKDSKRRKRNRSHKKVRSHGSYKIYKKLPNSTGLYNISRRTLRRNRQHGHTRRTF
jgi:hypothetical protein